MKNFPKNKKGFIQIPIFIAIIVSVLVLSGASYFGVKQYKKYQAEKSQQEIIVQDKQITSIDEFSEVEKLRQEVEELKKQQSTPIPPLSKSNQIQEKLKTTVSPVVSIRPIPSSKKAQITFTTPNGAVIDEAGNVISPPKNTIQTQTMQLPVAGSRVLTSEEIYSAVSPSVVLVSTSNVYGSGFVIDDGKYTITNAHVVGDSQTVQLKLQSGTSFNGTVLGKDNSRDLAVIFNGDQRPPAVKLGSSNGSSLPIGSDVFALGFPENLVATVTFTRGTLSARQDVDLYPDTLLQMDAAINRGNSGGPLVNNKGEVIGVNTFVLQKKNVNILEQPDVIQGIFFAIPIQTAIGLIPALSQYGQSRVESYPVGSTMTIKRSMAIQIDFNDTLSCDALGFKDENLNLCNLYKNYNKDYKWNFIEDVSH